MKLASVQAERRFGARDLSGLFVVVFLFLQTGCSEQSESEQPKQQIRSSSGAKASDETNLLSGLAISHWKVRLQELAEPTLSQHVVTYPDSEGKEIVVVMLRCRSGDVFAVEFRERRFWKVVRISIEAISKSLEDGLADSLASADAVPVEEFLATCQRPNPYLEPLEILNVFPKNGSNKSGSDDRDRVADALAHFDATRIPLGTDREEVSVILNAKESEVRLEGEETRVIYRPVVAGSITKDISARKRIIVWYADDEAVRVRSPVVVRPPPQGRSGEESDAQPGDF